MFFISTIEKHLCFDCKFAHRIEEILSLLLLGPQALLVLGQHATESSGLLGPQVQGLILLALVELPQVLLLCLVDDS